MRQHTSACVSMRQHTSACVSIRPPAGSGKQTPWSDLFVKATQAGSELGAA
jgi:hypothetical protein